MPQTPATWLKWVSSRFALPAHNRHARYHYRDAGQFKEVQRFVEEENREDRDPDICQRDNRIENREFAVAQGEDHHHCIHAVKAIAGQKREAGYVTHDARVAQVAEPDFHEHLCRCAEHGAGEDQNHRLRRAERPLVQGDCGRRCHAFTEYQRAAAARPRSRTLRHPAGSLYFRYNGSIVSEEKTGVAEQAPEQTKLLRKGDIPRGVIAEWTVTIILLLFGTTTLVQAFVIPTGS